MLYVKAGEYMMQTKKLFLIIVFLALISGLYAQNEFPAGDYWLFNGGIGISGILVDGMSYQIILDPKLWLSPPLMVGGKVGINYSVEDSSDSSDSEFGNILTFEGQVYLRWNMLRLGQINRKTNIFIQGGLGLLAAYRGKDNPFNEVTMTRGSVMADAALGVTIPLTERWVVEPLVRGGYPHIFGFSVTAGYKIPLPKKVTDRVHYVEIIKTVPPNEIIKRIRISSVEFIIFGPDIGRYNVGIGADAQQLNELILEQIAMTLKENSNYRIRIEGHANPYTVNYSEIDDLMALSSMRAGAVAEQLSKRGVSDEQMVIVGFGGTRTATSELDIRNRNRRVEMITILFDED